MTESPKIRLGLTGEGHPVTIDIPTLISTRLLVTASSGGGKSETLRRILEEAIEHVQCVVIDPEGEFSTLRERKPFVLVGEGGETPADIRTASLVATRLLELNASAVCDIYEMKIQDRHEWVRRFLGAMVQAPKALWHPVLVIVDEAHTYAPEKGYGESVALQPMIDLANLGRKRGFCLIPATQRLSKLSKNVTEPMQNILVGRTMFDDQERAARIFKIKPGAETRDFSLELERLKDGQFIGRGRAFNGDMLKVQVTRAQTRPPTTGTAMAGVVTPAPAAIRELLPRLADLPHEAQRKEETEESLRGELTKAKHRIAELEREPGNNAAILQLENENRSLRSQVEWARNLTKLVDARGNALMEAADKLADIALDMRLASGSEKFGDQLPPETVKTITNYPENYSSAPRSEPRPKMPPANGSLGGAHLKILAALAKLAAVGIDAPARIQVALFAGYSNAKSGGFAGPMAFLAEYGYARIGNGCVSLTPEGMKAAGAIHAPATTRELHEQLRQLLGSAEWKILENLISCYPAAMDRIGLAKCTGYSNAKSGGFAGPLARLTSLGLAEVPAPGAVRATQLLFLKR